MVFDLDTGNTCFEQACAAGAIFVILVRIVCVQERQFVRNINPGRMFAKGLLVSVEVLEFIAITIHGRVLLVSVAVNMAFPDFARIAIT